ncbi:MAG: desulfoferrodoxin [Elusimicrobiales bacterium]|nr:desulfoferrodoxin [Elusimicrobiales bacterium]
MAELKGIYKCEVCGNIVEVLHSGAGKLVCCGKEMKYFNPNSTDGAKEKHVPVITKTSTGYIVKVGSVEHPMEDKHYIEWIELIADGISHRKFLKLGDKPEAEFCVKANKVEAREYCNLHGLWKAELA